jgi:methyl-accepting chemotaxis protein
MEAEMNTAQRIRRRNYFINKEFQGRAIFQYFLLVLAGSILFTVIFSLFSQSSLSIVYDNYHLELGTTPEILLEKIFSTQWAFIVIGGIFMAVITLFLSHRVAGPFYRFEKSLDAMIEGDISGSIHLRKKDEGKTIARKLNDFNAMVAARLAALESLAGEVDALAEGITGESDQAAAARIREKCREMDAQINAFTFSRR